MKCPRKWEGQATLGHPFGMDFGRGIEQTCECKGIMRVSIPQWMRIRFELMRWRFGDLFKKFTALNL